MKIVLNKRQEQSAKLIKRALEELLELKRYEDITIARICEKSTVSRNTFYRIFSSKDDALDSLIKEKTSTLIECNERIINLDLSCPDREDVYKSYLGYYSHWLKEKEFLIILNKRKLFNAFYVYHEKYFMNNSSDKLIQLYEYSENVKGYYYKWHSYSLAAIIEQWVENGFKETPEELAEMTINLYLILGKINTNKKH